jgi:Na+-driven multidrug efflux pump
MTCISIIIGTLTACETLQPRAFGLGQYREVGLLAIRGLFMCILSLLVPITVLLTRAESIFDNLGQDPDASILATE